MSDRPERVFCFFIQKNKYKTVADRRTDRVLPFLLLFLFSQ